MTRTGKGFYGLRIAGVLSLSLLLMGCGSGSNGQSPGAESSTVTVNDYHFTEVSGTETPIAATITDKSGTETLSIMAEKDANGNPIRITGAAYTSKEGYSGIIEVGTDGLPLTLTDSSGSKATFTNYTGSSVDITVYDSDGNLVVGPVTTSIDTAKIQEIRELFGSISLAAISSKGGLRSSKIFRETSGWAKWGGTVYSWAGCAAAAYMTGGIALVPCGSALLGTVAKFTENDIDNATSLTISSSKCLICSTSLTSALTDLPCVLGCMSVLTNLIAGDYIVDPVDASAPSIPADPAASSVSLSQIDLSWSAPPESDVAGYKIYRDGAYLKFVAATSASDTGLSSATRYCYTVSAYDAAWNESGQSSRVCATTPAPGSAPTGVTATGGDGQVSIAWNAVSDATSYNIYWSTTSGVAKTTGIKIPNAASPYTHIALTNGAAYYYVVTAVNAYGEGGESGEASAKPDASPISPWPMFGHDAQHTGRSGYAGIQATSLNQVWSKTYGDIMTNYALKADITMGADGAVYALSGYYSGTFLAAINPDTGLSKWSYQLKDSTGYSITAYGPPTVGKDGIIYLGDYDDYIHAIDPANGSQKWRRYYPLSAPMTIGSDGTIYIVNANGYLVSIDPDGAEKWRYQPSDTVIAPLSAAIGTDGTIYCGIKNNLYGTGGIAAINPDGSLNWRYTFDNAVSPKIAPAVGMDGTVYIGTLFYLYAINADGTLKWSETFSSTQLQVKTPSIASDGTIYVAINNTVYAISPADGSINWQKSLSSITSYGQPSLTIDANGIIYAGTHDTLYAINPDGTENWKYYRSYAYFSSPKIGSDGSLYISTYDGLEKYGSNTGGRYEE